MRLKNLLLGSTLLALQGCINTASVGDPIEYIANAPHKIYQCVFEECPGQQKEFERQQEEYQKSMKEQGLTEIKGGYLFIANSWEDINNNGIAEFPEEFTGIKRRFSTNERVTAFLYLMNGGKFQNYQVFIFGNGQKIGGYNMQGRGIGSISFNNLQAGNYEAKWYVENQFVGSNNFEVGN